MSFSSWFTISQPSGTSPAIRPSDVDVGVDVLPRQARRFGAVSRKGPLRMDDVPNVAVHRLPRTIAMLAAGVLFFAGRPGTAAVTVSGGLDPAVAGCVKAANTAYKACTAADCVTPFKTAVGTCFAPGSGVSCGATCASAKGACDKKTATALAACQSGCKASVDAACGSACDGDAFIADTACKASINSCLLKCPVPGTVVTTSTITSKASTTSTTASTTVKTTTTSSVLKGSKTTTTAPAAKTTTSTTVKGAKTTTTTTLPPLPPFSAATAACVQQLAAALATCTSSSAACQGIYADGFPRCFATGDGAACAATCENADLLCEIPAGSTKGTTGKTSTGAKCKLGTKGCTSTSASSCKSNCQNTWVASGSRCNGGPACLAATLTARSACETACAKPTAIAQCRATFSGCLGACANLDDGRGTVPVGTTTTSLRSSSTTSSSTSITAPRTTTTTTVPPASSFSPATTVCIAGAEKARTTCLATKSAASCDNVYRAASADCFAPGAGVACAAGCQNTEAFCETVAGTVGCTKACTTTWTIAGALCRGDARCLGLTSAAFSACPAACAHPAPVGQCRSALTACLGACPNLGGVGTAAASFPNVWAPAGMTPRSRFPLARAAAVAIRPVPITGKVLQLGEDAVREKKTLRIESRDAVIGIGRGNGSTDDPTIFGATVRVMSPAFDTTYSLPANQWKSIGTPGANVGYRYADVNRTFGPFRLGLFKAANMRTPGTLRFVAQGPGLGHSLGRDPSTVSVIVTIGTRRFWAEYGGTRTFHPGRSFEARNAPRPTASAP